MATLEPTINENLARPKSETGLISWLTTVDHKRIGILYLVTALVFFLVGGIEAFIIRLQLAAPNQNLVSPDMYNQLFTMHGTTMIFLAIMPLSAAFFNYLIPLMIGARDVAFPRLNAFSYWMFLFGGIFLNSSWILEAAPNAGWFGYANLTSTQFNPGLGVDFWILGLQLLGIGTLVSGFNFIVTILNMRAPGMSLMRLPIFVWTTLITSFLIIFAFPVITVGLIMLFFDRAYGTNFFEVAAGGDVLLWQHLFWIFGHPEVYILILPAMGIVSEVLPTFSRKPLFGYPVVVYSALLIAIMGFAVWSHHMFAVGMGPVVNSIFALTTMAIAVPTGVKIFNWIATLWGGKIRFTTPLWFAIGFVWMFIIGGLSGVMHSAAPSDAQQHDTYFIVAHLHYVLIGGSLFAVFAGIYYWFPKMTGRLMSESMGKWNFWFMMIGFNITFFPFHFLGVQGMPRRVYTYDEQMGWEFWNLVSTIGVFILSVGILIFLYNMFVSVRRGERAGPDPWDARTLEWAISSPPPVYNFAEIPTVRGRDAFWVEKHGDPHADPPAAEADAVPHAAAAEDAGDGHGHGGWIHMPAPSWTPLLVSLLLTSFAYGLMYSIWVAGISLGAAILGLIWWGATSDGDHYVQAEGDAS